MLRLILSTLTPLVLLCACGGGGGGGNPVGGNPDLAELSQCTADALAVIAVLIDDFEPLIAEINGTDRVEVTLWDQQTGAYTLEADLNEDGFAETTVSGQVANIQGDYADGLDVGDSIAAGWALVAGPVLGDGQFGYTELAGNQRRLTGSGNVTLVDGCMWTMPNVNLTFSTVAATPPSGTIDFVVTKDGKTLSGTVTMNGTDIANVSATLNGVTVNFKIDTDDFTLVP